jgi:hypothetical protein
MSVALLIKDASAETEMVPVATEATYRTMWQDGAKALALDWVEALQFGVVITEENRADIVEQLEKLHSWFESNALSQLERLELLVSALKAVRFDHGQTAWIG